MPDKVLVTGASGFIGSHLTEALVRRGCAVRAFIRYNSNSLHGNLAYLPKEILDQVEIFFGDIRDAETVWTAVQDVSTVYHLASVISTVYSYQHPEETAAVNFNGALNVLQATRQKANTKVLLCSTSDVYDTAQYTPIDEKHPRQAQSPYAATKIAAEALAESYFSSFGTPITIVRPFNTFGPRQSTRAIVPTIIVQALTRDKVQLGALHPTRDLSYVSDIVEGFIQAAGSTQANGEKLNFGSGTAISIGELAEKIIGLIGRPVRLETDERRLRPRQSDVLRAVSGNQKAREILGWQPQLSLEAGLQLTIEWIQANLAHFDPESYII